MKNSVLLVVAVVVTIGALVLAFISFEKQNKLSKSLEQERYSRMVAEESSQKSAAKLATSEVQLRSAEDRMAKVKDLLDQENGVSSDLKKQYEKIKEEKEALENKVRDLAAQKEAADKAVQELSAKVESAAVAATEAPQQPTATP